MLIVGADASDPSLIDQFGPWVVPGSIALLGVWLGKVWERRGGRQAWRRDRRLEAYAKFIDAAHTTWLSTTGDLWNNAQPELWGELINRWRERANRLGLVGSEIDILGPAEVADAANKVIDSHTALAKRVNAGIPEPEARRRLTSITRSPEGMAAQKALEMFTAAAGRALE